MITTSKVREVLDDLGIQYTKVEEHGDKRKWFLVRLEPQCINSHDFEIISRDLNDALFNFHFGARFYVLNIHPYIKEY